MLRIRMSRQGSIHKPFYRLVVSDSRKRPESTALDTLGFYDPRREPARLEIDLARADEWIRKGATPSGRVDALIRRARKESRPVA